MAIDLHADAKVRAGRMLARRYDYLPDRLRSVHRTSRTEDYVVAPFEGNSPYPDVETLTQLGHAWHYRVQFASSYGSGRGEFCGLSDGFFVYFGDWAFARPLEMTVTAPDMLRIRVGTKGCGEYVADQQQPVRFDGPSTLVLIEPVGVPPAQCAIEGHNRAVQLYVRRSVLKDLYEGDEADLPGILKAFVAGALPHAVVRHLPLTPALLRCLEDLQTCAAEGRTRRHYIKSKAMEIFCHTCEGLANEDSFGSPEASLLISKGVHKVQAILMERFVSPPSLEDLAREVGLSRTGLTAGFRRMFGQSVFDYIEELRMQHALTLLKAPDSSITQVAYAVGYNHPSSFSVAVRRRFGASPSDLRRCTTPGTGASSEP